MECVLTYSCLHPCHNSSDIPLVEGHCLELLQYPPVFVHLRVDRAIGEHDGGDGALRAIDDTALAHVQAIWEGREGGREGGIRKCFCIS